MLSWPPAMICDLTTGAIDQLCERFDSLQRCRTPARGEHTFDSQVDQGIECFERRRRLVKRLMKGDAERPGQCDEGLRSGRGRCAGSAVKTPSTTPAAPSVLVTSISCRMTAISGSE